MFYIRQDYYLTLQKIYRVLPLFKKRPFLKDLIPEQFVDIHSHLLPGIDDGSKNIEMTVDLLRQLKDLCFSQFITTPHVTTGVWDNTREEIQAKFEETQQFLSSANHDFPLRVAAEYILDANFTELLQHKKLLTLKDNLVLVEMSYINPPLQLFDLIFELQIAGYVPVLAHPERYGFYHNNFSEFSKLKNAGCKFQINLLSTVGYYGPAVAECAEKLLKNGMIDFVGSDVHHQKHIDAFSLRILIKETTALKSAVANNDFFRI